MRVFKARLYAEPYEVFAEDAFKHLVGTTTRFLGYRAKVLSVEVQSDGSSVLLEFTTPAKIPGPEDDYKNYSLGV